MPFFHFTPRQKKENPESRRGALSVSSYNLNQPQKYKINYSPTHRFDTHKTNSNIGNTSGATVIWQHLVRLVSQMGKSPYVARVCWHLVRLFLAAHLPCVKGKRSLG